MGDRDTFNKKLEALRINVYSLKEVRVHVPAGQITIPNQDGKRGSLQVYATIATNDGYIGPAEAKRGLDIFGEELREEARTNPGKHPNIDTLENIIANGLSIRTDVIRNYSAKPIPAPLHKALPEIVMEFETPFHIYDEAGIRQTARALNLAFSWVQPVRGFGFRNYFAVKALPNPSIIKILKQEGMGADCSSLPELHIARAGGLNGEEIMFTSNDTPENEFRLANNLGAIINFDDLSHIDFFRRNIGEFPEIVCCRYNPGNLKKGNSIIGTPAEAKYGFTREQLSQGFKKLKDSRVRRFGLHTMVASNELDPDYFVETARTLFETVRDLSQELGINFEFVNLGGGIGTPYKPEQRAVDLARVSDEISRAYEELIIREGLPHLRVVMENGRMVSGPNGFLVSKVLHVAKKHKDYVGLDACMANLMRPALYGAYHEITVLGKEDKERTHIYDVTGSLCENNDKFAINRPLPKIDEGDVVVIHNTGAHGYAMGFNYNGKLRCPEYLFKEDGSVKMIRRRETPKDYFGTLVFDGSEFPDFH